MRLLELHVKGFRSLADVRLGGPELPLGAFNVFYGPNGSGKSNVLAAVGLVGEACRALASVFEHRRSRPPGTVPGRVAPVVLPLGLDDYRRGKQAAVRLSFALRLDPDVAGASGVDRIEVTLEQARALSAHHAARDARVERIALRALGEVLELPAKELLWQDDVVAFPTLARDAAGAFVRNPGTHDTALGTLAENEVLDLLVSVFHEAANQFSAVSAVRAPETGGRPRSSALDALPTKRDPAEAVGSLLAEGQIEKALLEATTSPDRGVRDRLGVLRELLAGPPLHRPPFAATKDPATGLVEVREELPGGGDVPVHLAGLGVYQLYAVLAGIVLGGAQVVCVEEPEAHLHAPTTGRQLRELLVRSVEEGFIEQLFIATHSNLFDLDPDGYFDVRLQGAAGAVQHTVVERKPLVEIDGKHLYEPGPAKHALADMLHRLASDKVVFRKAAGEPVTAKEMIILLQADDEVALDYLRDLHGALVSLLRAKVNREPTA